MLIQKLMFVAKPASAVVLYLLIALSVLSIGVIIERWWYFRRRRVNIIELGEQLERALRTGDTAAALALLKRQPVGRGPDPDRRSSLAWRRRRVGRADPGQGGAEQPAAGRGRAAVPGNAGQ